MRCHELCGLTSENPGNTKTAAAKFSILGETHAKLFNFLADITYRPVTVVQAVESDCKLSTCN